MNRNRLAVLSAVALAVAGAAVAGTGPAVADVSRQSPPMSVAIGPAAIIHARGAELTVLVTAVCPTGGYATMQVEQERGGVVVSGSKELGFTCTNGATHLELHVVPGYLPWLSGTAHVKAVFYYARPASSVTAERDVTVAIG